MALRVFNPVGLVLGGIWGVLVFMTVRNDWDKLELLLILGLPVCYIMPIFNIVIGRFPPMLHCSSRQLDLRKVLHLLHWLSDWPVTTMFSWECLTGSFLQLFHSLMQRHKSQRHLCCWLQYFTWRSDFW